MSSASADIDCGNDCSQDYTTEAVVMLAALPVADSHFGGWSGDCSGSDPMTTVTMTADRVCTATFNRKPSTQIIYDLSPSAVAPSNSMSTVRRSEAGSSS